MPVKTSAISGAPDARLCASSASRVVCSSARGWLGRTAGASGRVVRICRCVPPVSMRTTQAPIRDAKRPQFSVTLARSTRSVRAGALAQKAVRSKKLTKPQIHARRGEPGVVRHALRPARLLLIRVDQDGEQRESNPGQERCGMAER